MVLEAIGVCYVQLFRMSDIKHTNASIKHFVRESLGCACPDNVFENITVTERSGIFASASTVYEIGGRLFVAVFVPLDWHDMAKHLGKFVVAGKQYRDQHGYNRFRLVIVTDNNDAAKHLQIAYASLPNIDEKTHLHVIKPEVLPRGISPGC